MRTILVSCLLLVTLFPLKVQAAHPTDIHRFIKDARGQNVGFYTGSYALIIGVSDYGKGWTKLDGVAADLDRFESALKRQGFHSG